MTRIVLLKQSITFSKSIPDKPNTKHPEYNRPRRERFRDWTEAIFPSSFIWQVLLQNYFFFAKYVNVLVHNVTCISF